MPAHLSRRHRRTWLQRFVIVGNVVAAFTFLVAAAGLAYGYTKYSRLPRVELADVLGGEEADELAGSAQNFLLVGVDSAENLDSDDPVRSTRGAGGFRSDTMMILRVDPASTRAALLSLPRDLWVELSTGGSNRINAAVEIGGPEALIDTIQEYLGIPIHHYLQVDFDGFGRIVEAIGGVPMHFPHPARDAKSQLDISETGCVVLDADSALSFVRSRSYQQYVDGRWKTDGSGDFGRMRRQQEFILTALDRAFDRGARNPVTLDELIDGTIDAVTLDDALDVSDIVGLAREFGSFTSDAVDIYEVPVYDDVIGGAQVLRLDSRRAEPTIALFRGVDPDAVDEGSTRLRVLNGTGTPGEAADVGADLAEAGFVLSGTGDAESLGVTRTEIRHAPEQVAAAELVQRWLSVPARLVADTDAIDITLVTGSDYRGVRSIPRPPESTTTTVLPTSTSRPHDGPTTSDDTGPPDAPAGPVGCA